MPYTLVNTSSKKEYKEKSVHVLKKRITMAVAKHRCCIIGLSGGLTPKPVYRALNEESIDWQNVKGFFIDERYVPFSHEKSNRQLVCESLPKISLTAPDTSLPIALCVKKYEQDLQKLFGDLNPDIVILGMGTDGHIASLFPPVPRHLRDHTHIVAHVVTDLFDIPDRITLTLGPIRSARSHIILLEGREKKIAWETMIASNDGEERWPLKAILNQSDVSVITLW